MLHALVVSLALASPPSTLPPAAAEHNVRAMAFYDEGRFDLAADEFLATYHLLSDARTYRTARDLLVGSIRAALLALHAKNGEVEPLCRLRDVLRTHIDALSAAYPGNPDLLESRGARARHLEISRQIEAHGPDACVDPPARRAEAVAPPIIEAPPLRPDRTVASSTLPADVIVPDEGRPRMLRIVGGAALGLGAVLIGAMTYGLLAEIGHRRGANAIDASAEGRPLTLVEYDVLLDHRRDALLGRRIAVGTGIAAAITGAVGATMFLLSRRPPQPRRWSAMPWWRPTGAGLSIQWTL